MLKLMKKLNEAVQNLSFLIVFYCLYGIFLVLLTVSMDTTFKYSVAYISFVVLYSTLSITIFISYTICSSMIPENLIRIKDTVKDFVNGNSSRQFITKQTMFYLHRIENEESLHISACGLFNLTRSFILSALGAVLTYGLLIMTLGLKHN